MRELNTTFQSEFDLGFSGFDGNAVLSGELYASEFGLPVELRAYSGIWLGFKRGIDLAGSLLMIAVCLIPGLLIGAAVALTSEGPVFYREERIGQGGRPFRIWKFRSMRNVRNVRNVSAVESASASAGNLLQWRVNKKGRDPRITAVGGFLRRWSLDELPQVLNVLRGEMSLVGPRPVIEAEIPLYGHLQHLYLAAKPGLSGLWQVSGRSNVSFAGRASLDAYYVRNWSLFSDLRILARTVPAVLGRVGAR
jgi:lipopolysaccharide/colanic/teichoic acid biosynthesis glycosyltransferase